MSDIKDHPPMTQDDEAKSTSGVKPAKDDMFRVLIVSEDIHLIERVSDGLRSLATVASAEPQITMVDELIDGLDADLMVLDLDARPADGESLLDIVRVMKQRRPGLPIVTSGDSLSAQLVLAAMRAGAVDFIDRDITTEEVRMQIAAHLHRHHDRQSVKSQAPLHVFCSAREDHDTTIAAVNLAGAFAAQGNRTLLLDLTAQGDESSLALGVEPAYTVEDALLDLPRLDETLLLSALTHHKSTDVYLLPMQLVNSNSLSVKEVLDPAKVNSMLTLIRPFFDQIVVNVSGPWLTIGLGPLLSISAVGAAFDYLVVQPNLISVSGASRLIRQVFGQADADEISKSGLRLLLVNEEADQSLTGYAIADAFGLPYAGALPAAPLHHPDAINEGLPLIVTEPGHEYSKHIRKVLIGEEVPMAVKPAGIVARMRRMVGRG